MHISTFNPKSQLCFPIFVTCIAVLLSYELIEVNGLKNLKLNRRTFVFVVYCNMPGENESAGVDFFFSTQMYIFASPA